MSPKYEWLPSFFIPREWIIKSPAAPPEEPPPAMRKKQNDPEAVRRARVRSLFACRYGERPDGNDVLAFYQWLEGRHPELLPQVKHGADSYQQLKVDLHGLYRD